MPSLRDSRCQCASHPGLLSWAFLCRRCAAEFASISKHFHLCDSKIPGDAGPSTWTTGIEKDWYRGMTSVVPAKTAVVAGFSRCILSQRLKANPLKHVASARLKPCPDTNLSLGSAFLSRREGVALYSASSGSLR